MVSQTATEALRSHNHPPELVDANVAIRREVAVVIAALDESETELARTVPDPSILRRVGLAILSAAKAIANYCIGLADTALKKAAEELGTTGTKWAIRTTTAYYAAQSEPIHIVGKAIFDFATKWFSS